MSAHAHVHGHTLERLARRLQGSAPRHEPADWRLGTHPVAQLEPALRELMPATLAPAAVLVGLVDHPGDPALLLTVRADALARHAGQIAFPGGRIEDSDVSPAAAALREAREEIGLDDARVAVLGYLPDHLVLTGYRVTPVVARIPPDVSLRLDPAEVAQLFELPWSALLDESICVHGERSFGGVRVKVRDIHYAGHRIWGLTAAILDLLRETGADLEHG